LRYHGYAESKLFEGYLQFLPYIFFSTVVLMHALPHNPCPPYPEAAVEILEHRDIIASTRVVAISKHRPWHYSKWQVDGS